MNTKEVTEKDFRSDKFKFAKVEDYEFREDGEIVRKDRWEAAVRAMAGALKINTRDFEIVQVVQAVDDLILKSRDK